MSAVVKDEKKDRKSVVTAVVSIENVDKKGILTTFSIDNLEQKRKNKDMLVPIPTTKSPSKKISKNGAKE